MRKKAVLAVTALAMISAVFANISAYAAAQAASAKSNTGAKQFAPFCHTGEMAKRSHVIFGKLAKDLNLTDTQKAELAQIHKKFRAETEPSREQMKTRKSELIGLLAEGADRATITRKAEDLTGIHGEITRAGISKLLDAREVLTPEQRAVVAEKVSELKSAATKCPLVHE